VKSKADYTRFHFQPPNTNSSWFWGMLVGFHLVQFILFLSLYFSNLTKTASRIVSWLQTSEPTTFVDNSVEVFNIDCLVDFILLYYLSRLPYSGFQTDLASRQQFLQYTTEWSVPQNQAASCLSALRNFFKEELEKPSGLRVHFPIEVRFTKEDDIWLSPSYGQRTVYIGIIQFK